MNTKLIFSIQPFHLLPVLPLFLIFTQFAVLSRCCHDYERNALLSFKSFLSDPADRLLTWQIGQNCCNWHGIQCSNDSGSLHVVTLDLRNTNLEIYLGKEAQDTYFDIDFFSLTPATALNGTMSPSLFNLTHLEYLDLSYNDFQNSKISHQFADLKKLTHLDLSNSGFSDVITTQFANLSSLEYLDVSCFYALAYNYYVIYSSLQASTNWLRGLVDLKVLKLNGVDMSVFSSPTNKNWAEPISYLADLRELHLSGCGISSSFPIKEFLNLSRLSSLKMNDNDLENSQIPIKLANLTSLSVLDLSGSSLRGEIPYLPQLKELHVGLNENLKLDLTRMFEQQWPKLHTLNIRYNTIFGLIPNSISNASLLANIVASFCSIRGSFPTSILNLSQLRYLDLSNSQITGHLPSSISNLSQLEYLYLDVNNITGHLPSSISNLKNLKVLSINQNNLQGPIPESLICEMSSLQLLHFTGNNLTGPIPSCTTKLRNIRNFELKSLVLSSCNLKGYIPSFICNLTHLDTLDLSHNNLQGAVPSCLFEIQTLVNIDMSGNNLQGTLPQYLQHNLRIFNLSRNNFLSLLPIPPRNALVFDLSENNFTGKIAIEMGERLSSARYVSLSGNELSGSIPSSICPLREHPELYYNLGSLMFLDLSNNHFTGTIPSSLGYCLYLFSLHLGKNNLIGNVPNELKQAKNLNYLQLNDNKLNGTFPTFIQHLKYLNVLNLGNNNFVGSIPTFIQSLIHLQVLSLRSNNFNGSIPKEIMYLTQLQILDLSRNNFSGPIPRNIGNLSMLRSRSDNTYTYKLGTNALYNINVQFQMAIKGITTPFEHLYNYNSGIDLSYNVLEGDIPEGMGLLKGLVMLSLSHNRFSAKIPTSIGNMISLESLDLSFNKLSGDIPQSLTSIDSLGYLNLSYNNLSSRIPRGPHFETLSVDGSAYIGNPLLCGVPTNKRCEGDPIPSGDPQDEDDQENDPRLKWVFYGIVALGYGVGFWGLFFVLLLKREKWWSGYWRVVDSFAARLLG